jgi:hypothetical protein
MTNVLEVANMARALQDSDGDGPDEATSLKRR